MQTANYPLNKGNKYNKPKFIVLHAMGEFIEYEKQHYHATEFLKLVGLSAHRLITPSGVVIKCREDNQGAWHAKGYNTDSLGIEFLVPGVHNYKSFLKALKTSYLTSKALKAGVEILKYWMDKFDIDKIDIKSHQQIDPDRKHDPGIITEVEILNLL